MRGEDDGLREDTDIRCSMVGSLGLLEEKSRALALYGVDEGKEGRGRNQQPEVWRGGSCTT